MAQLGFYFDSSRCTGCKTCNLVCKDYKDLGPEITLRKVYDIEGGTWDQNEGGTWVTSSFAYHVSVACNHCIVPACLDVCPAESITKDPDTGLVVIDDTLCIGCGSCVAGCPYGAPKIDESTNIAKKCDGCIDLVKEGKAPICTEGCPLRALEFDEVETLRGQFGDVAEIPPLPAADQTYPNLAINPPAGISTEVMAAGVVVNEYELV